MRVNDFGLFLLIVPFICVFQQTNGMEELSVHNPVEEVCRQVSKRLRAERSATLCMPRMALVKLKAEPEFTYFPNVVSVKRCHGFCQNHVSCMPIAKNFTTVYVKRQSINSATMTCHRVLVEEHTACRCKCNVMKEDCNSKQKYAEEECACKCINIKEKQNCIAKRNSRWNPETCSCMCDQKPDECSTDLQWLPQYCKCLRVMDGNKIMKNEISYVE